MTNTFRKVYKKTGNSGTSSDYQLVGNIGVGGVELDLMKGATSSVDGELGLVPKPTTGQEDYVLTGAGIFKTIDSIYSKKLIAESLITVSFAEQTSETTFNTYLGRKISSYPILIFSMCDDNSSIRESSVVPSNLFTNDEPIERIFLSAISGTESDINYTQLAIRYINDTSFGVRRTVGTSVNNFQCIGLRLG